MFNKTFIIAELSANHNNDFLLARDTISAMKDSGADAVKFQTYKPESLTLNITNKYFYPRKEGLWKGYHPYDLYKKAATPYEWHPKLVEHAKSIGLEWLSSPFDYEGIDFLESIKVPIYKIASMEIKDTPLIRYAAEKNKPIIISTGAANLADIELAVRTCRDVGNYDITLLKCTSAYPTPYSEVNLRAIPTLKASFNTKVGLSDHTSGHSVPLGAVTLGATVVEKHFILDRKLGGIDSAFSMEPKEFKEMVLNVRQLEEALGSAEIVANDKVEKTRERGRSLFAVKDIRKGDVFSEDNVRSLRPGCGLHPKYLKDIIGKKSDRDFKKGDPLQFEFFK